ncbi:recombinase family protein [Blautia schinkii]|nr:recombinase family protein [Blautia schinkii]
MQKRYRIAIYLRLSKEDEDMRDESNSISSQRTMLKKYVMENFECYSLTEFVDDGFSGTNFRRPGIQKMLSQIQNGDFDCVIVKDFSRFSRDYIELGSYQEHIFPFLGVRFISLNDGYDSRNFVGNANDLNSSFKGLMYDLYSKDLSLKVKSSLETRKKQGQYASGNTTFGYMKSPADRHKLIIAEDEAEVVRRIFSLALEGKTSTEISRILNQERINTPLEFRNAKKQINRVPLGKKFQWTTAAVCSILRNPVYIGDMVYNKYYRAEVGGKNHIKPRSEWEIYKDHHDAIISREVFEEIQNRKKGQRIEKRKLSGHPLQGKIVCGNCKHAMCLRTSLNPYFSCERRYSYANGENCVSKANLMFVEQYVLFKIEEVLCSRDNLEKLYAKINADIHKKIGDLEKNRDRLEKRKDMLFRKRMEDYEKSVFSDFKFDKDDKEIVQTERRIDEINKQIEELEAKIPVNKGKSVQDINREKLQLTKELTDELIHKIIVYDEEHIEIEWRSDLRYFGCGASV